MLCYLLLSTISVPIKHLLEERHRRRIFLLHALVLLEVSNQITTIVRLLESSKDHLGSLDVFLRVLQVVKHFLLSPCDTCGC